VNSVKPKISVLIPCYNQAENIKNVVEALRQQTTQPDEIVVVDDASQDESAAILKSLPVKLICHVQNRGLSATRNTAIQAASGDILVLIDADAVPEKHLIEVLLDGYHQKPNDKLGGVGGQGIECKLETVYDRWRAQHASQNFGAKPRDRVPYLFGLCMSFTREALEKVGGFDPFFSETCGEDVDIGIRLRRAGYWLRYRPDAIVYHQHSDTRERLLRTHYNWSYWNYILKKRHNLPVWRAYAGIFRRLFTETLSDLLIRRDIELAALDIAIFKQKFSATRKASKTKVLRRKYTSIV